jgi:PAS domain S-box-containing protein
LENLHLNIPEFENIQELENQFKARREAIFVHDYDLGQIVHLNDAMLNMFGYTRQETRDIKLESIFSGTSPYSAEDVKEMFKRVKESGEISFEWHDRRKNGELFWTDNVMRIVKIGGQFRIIVLSHDISERKKNQLQLQALVKEHSREILVLNEKLTLANEELKIINEELENYKVQLEELVAIRTQELKRSEEKFSNVFHQSPCFIVVSSRTRGTILEVNEALTRKIGYTNEELIGKTLSHYNIIEKSESRKLQTLISLQGNYKNLEISLITKQKERLFCLGSGETVTIGQNQFIIEMLRDVTELKSVEQRLSLTEFRYSNFIEQSMEGVSYFHPLVPIDIALPPIDQARKLLHKSSLVECNESYSKMYGYDSGKYLFNKTMLEISGDILEDDWLKLLTEFVQSDHQLTNYPLTEIAEDGTILHFIHNLIGIIRDQKLIGVWNSRRNITDLKKAEELLKYKSEFEQLITGISTRFFDLTPELVDENIVNALQQVCDYIQADAGFLMEIDYDEGFYRLTHDWKNENIQYDRHYFERAPLKDLAVLSKIDEKSEYYLVNVSEITSDNFFVKSSFKKSGTASLLLIPIKYQNNMAEFAGFSTSKPGKLWSHDEISMLKLIGETLINALIRKSSEKILIQNERNYREIFNATNEGIFIHSAQTGKFIDANQAALELFGVAQLQDFESTSAGSGGFDPGFNQVFLREFTQQTPLNKSFVFEWLACRKNGESFWAEVSLKSSEIGGDLKVITVLRDVSERKKNEEAIRQSEERFRSIIQYLTDILFIIDANMKITYESPASAQVLGYEPGFLIGISSLQLVHPDDKDIVLNDLKEVYYKRNDYKPTEFRAKHQNGHWITLEAIANNMLDHPAIHGIIITCRDITERKMVEKALKISESKFRNIFNHSSDAIIMVNNNYSILEVNEIFLRLTGFSHDETLKMKVTDIITDTYLPEVVDKLIRLFQHENLPVLECEIRCKSKVSLPVEISSKLIEFEGELALVSIIRDITERRQLENRILETIISTEEKEREKFARNLHDELGPLLSSIKMYVNSLSSGIDKEKHDFIISQLKRILTEAIQSTKELSNDLSPHVLLNYGLVAALEWFNNQLKPYISVSLESNLKESRYSLSLELALYRIIKELINNTIKHANARSITIKLYLILGSIRLVYSDNGVGFPDKWQENIELLGMGMSNIMSRCRSINAVSKFYNHAPHGMSFEMEVPV